MRPAAVLFLFPTLQFALGAAPASTKTIAAGDERQVRATKEHVAVAVQPNGQVSEAPSEKIQSAYSSATARIEAKPHKAVESKAAQEKTAKEKTSVSKVSEAKDAEVAEAKPNDQKTVNLEQQALFIHTAAAEESWKSAFFFFASLVLIVVLAGACVFRLKQQTDQKQEPARQTLQASGSSASKLQSHLNDSSSTSDSGEKIAMLFDRVRQSLEDLSHEKGSGSATTGPGDVAGGKGGGGQI